MIQRRMSLISGHTSCMADQGALLLRPCALQLRFSQSWPRQADTSQRSIFTSVCAFCARTIIIITDTAGLLLPTIKCLWENSVNSGVEKLNLSRRSYHLLFNAVMAPKPQGERKREKENTLFAMLQGEYTSVLMKLYESHLASRF